MDPFSFKAGLESQAVDEWADSLHDNLIHRALGSVVGYIKFGIRAAWSLVRAGIPRRPEKVSPPGRNWADEKRA